jgi:hypothetical protein
MLGQNGNRLIGRIRGYRRLAVQEERRRRRREGEGGGEQLSQGNK